MNQSDLEVQILALLDGALAVDEVATLEAALLADVNARKTYTRLVDLHNALETRYASGATGARANLVPVERIVARQRRRMLNGALLAAAAALVILAAAMWMILAPQEPVSVGTFRTSPETSFVLTYEGEGEVPEKGQLAVGSRIRLSKGTMEGVFESGVRLVIEAPCDLRILARDRVELDEGKAWFQVPSEMAGFAAETPELIVVDLGTEFGLVSSPRDPDEVHVFEGAVEAHSRRQPESKETLKSGSARQVAADGRLVEVAPAPSRFRMQLDEAPSVISNFTFTGPPWNVAKENHFATFAAKAPSQDDDPNSTTSILGNRGYTSGGYDSFYIRDADLPGIAPGIFSTSVTAGVGMNIAGANQSAPTNFISFTVTPQAGYRTTFKSLSLYTGTIGANQSYTIEVRAWDGSAETILGVISHTMGDSQNEPVVLKSIDFADFSSTGPIEFRLYAYGVNESAVASQRSGIRFDDIVLKGNTAALAGSSPDSP